MNRIYIHENSKILRYLFKPFAYLFGHITRLDGAVFGRHIFLWDTARDYDEDVIWHEVCHVCQYEKYGKLKYIWHHCADWVNAKLDGMSNFSAYRQIRWEKEAYQVQNAFCVKYLYPQYSILIDTVKVYL